MATINSASRYRQANAQKYENVIVEWRGDVYAALAEAAIIDALKPIFEKMAQEARGLVLKDTMALHDSIESRVDINSTGTGIEAAIQAGDRGIPYAVMQEVGPQPGTKKASARARARKRKGQRANESWTFRPYIRPAFNNNIEDAQLAIKKALEKLA